MKILMWRSIFVAFGFWVARFVFRRQPQAIDQLTRMRNAGL